MQNKHCSFLKPNGYSGLKLLAIAMASASLSACSIPTETVDCCTGDTGEILIKAQGNEPFWNLTVFTKRVELNRLGEEQRAFFWQTDSAVESADATYQLLASRTSGVVGSVRFTEEVCRDSMTGMPYPQNVSVELDSAIYEGCAGNPIDLLTAGEWQVTHVLGKNIATTLNANINFGEEGEVYWNSGCNRFVGSYTLTGESFQLNQLASTRMACPSLQMDVETEMLKAFGDVISFNIENDGSLQLITYSGEYLRAILK